MGKNLFFLAPDHLEPNLPRRQMSSMTGMIFLRGEGIMKCVSHFSDGGSTTQIRQGDGAKQTTPSPPSSRLKAPVRGLKLPAPLAAPLFFFFLKVGINRANLTELRYEMKSFMRLNSRKLPAFNGLFTLRNGSLRWFSLMCKQCFMNSKLLVIVLKNQNNSNNKILPSMHPKESPEFCLQECPEALRICKVTGPSETRECARPQFCACFSQDLVSSQSLFWFHCKHSHK